MVGDALRVHKITKYLKCSDTFMYLMHISYNNLPNEGSQAG